MIEDILKATFLEQLHQMDKEEIRKNLLFASTFITVYESFKAGWIDALKNFYNHKADYEREVLSLIEAKENKTIRATVEWHLKNNVIDASEKQQFKKITDTRNRFAHSLMKVAMEGISDEDR